MKPRFVTRAPLAVIGMRIITKPMSPEIPELWPRFIRRVHEISGILEPRVSYGVMRMQAGEAGGLMYLAGVSVADRAAPVPAAMTAVTIPAGRYAVFEFPLSEIGSAFDFMFNTWLPSSGYTQVDGAPMFERYGEAFDPADPSSRMEAHIPIHAGADGA
jgi:AraC family transcriptional regulator